MMHFKKYKKITVCSLFVAFGISSFAQKFQTEIPKSIIIPDKVETRLGTLNFNDGFPDDKTIEKVYDNLDFQRGVQTFMTAMPAASLYAMREGLKSVGVNNQSVVVFEDRMDSKTLFLTANTESVYLMGWLDLKDGPIVIETPPNVLGFVNDFWFHYVADIGNAGPDRGKGGKFLFVPPNYKGVLPKGYFTYNSPTFGNWLVMRGFIVNGSSKTAVDNYKKHLKIYPLSKASAPPATNIINGSGKYFNTIHSMDYSFFEEVDHVVQEEPNKAIDPETLGLLASIGIEKGKEFAPDARMKKILSEAALVGNATVRALCYKSRIPEFYLFPNSAWGTSFIGNSYLFEHNDVRLVDPRSMFFFAATGISPAMTIAKVGLGSQYAGAFVDSKKQVLDGGKNYRIHLPPGIPAKDFWSFVVYDLQTRSMLQTDQQFPSLGSQNKEIVINADTSVDVYFGPKPPKGKENNWVQTMPGKNWFIILRLYGPLQSWFDKKWQPGEIEEL
ncbi:DUF1254 domain-containing protein [Flavobacterium mesophilum]|uniref:DUF1254 domain-containing protein n=1 Tax=Flavobacterium mesophilum TaxID=3143495 RepID=UPI0031D24096